MNTRQELHNLDYLNTITMRDSWQDVKMFFSILYIFMGWFSVSVEVFLRRDFGERYLSWLRLYLAWGVVAGFAFWLPILAGEGPSKLYFPIAVAFFATSLYHRWVISRRGRKGERWYSLSTGISWGFWRLLPFGKSEGIVYRYYEPVLCFVVGLTLYNVQKFIGVWLLLSTIALLVKNQMEYYQERSQMLDRIDSMITAQYFQEALTGDTAKQNMEGFSVQSAPDPSRPLKERQDFASTVAHYMGLDTEEETQDGERKQDNTV